MGTSDLNTRPILSFLVSIFQRYLWRGRRRNGKKAGTRAR